MACRLVGSSLAAHKKSFLSFRWINNHHVSHKPQPPRSLQTLELKAGFVPTQLSKIQELSRVYGFGGSCAISSCYARDVEIRHNCCWRENLAPCQLDWWFSMIFWSSPQPCRLAAWRIGLGFSDLAVDRETPQQILYNTSGDPNFRDETCKTLGDSAILW